MGGKALGVKRRGDKRGKESSLLDVRQREAGGEIKEREEKKKQNWERDGEEEVRKGERRRNNPEGRESCVVSWCCYEQVPGAACGRRAAAAPVTRDMMGLKGREEEGKKERKEKNRGD